MSTKRVSAEMHNKSKKIVMKCFGAVNFFETQPSTIDFILEIRTSFYLIDLIWILIVAKYIL
jgi:hypothetical protein